MGVALLLAFFPTIDDRTEEMLETSRDIALSNGYDDAVFVTGKGHLSGVEKFVREFPDLRIESAWSRRFFRSGTQVDGL